MATHVAQILCRDGKLRKRRVKGPFIKTNWGGVPQDYRVNQRRAFLEERKFLGDRHVSVYVEGNSEAISGYKCECVTARQTAGISRPLLATIVKDGLNARAGLNLDMKVIAIVGGLALLGGAVLGYYL